MPKIIERSLESERKKKGNIGLNYIPSPDGGRIAVSTVDASAATFGADLQQVFERNVRRARKENKEKTGLRDFAVEK